MDRSCTWTGRIFSLLDSLDLTGLLDVALAPVEALPGGGQQIWPPPPRKRRTNIGPSSSAELCGSGGPSVGAVEDGEADGDADCEASEAGNDEGVEGESNGSVSDCLEEEQVDMWALVKNHLDGLEESRGGGDDQASCHCPAAGGAGHDGHDGGSGGDDEGGDHAGGVGAEQPA
eukprot:5059038-Pyramimonas_sp.AAC.1